MRQAMTKNEALRRLCPPIVMSENLGDNNLTFGDHHNYVRVSLATNGTSGKYELVKLIHIRGGEKVDSWTINMTEDCHIPKPHPRPSIRQGGYWWAEDGKFYCWEPVGVTNRILVILNFTGVVGVYPLAG